jgi:hypothetical protein
MGAADRRKAFNFEVPKTEEFPLEINGDEVMCVDYVDGLKLLEFTSAMRDSSLGVGARATAMHKWLKTCIVESEWAKFEKIVAKNKIDIEDLGDISGYLADVYSERPTASAESSSTGRTTTGDGSRGSSSSEE